MPNRPLRVALIGLGDIAAKAYLPVLAADAEVEPVLVTRDPQRRAALQAAWRVPDGFASVEQALLARPGLDAAFVHAATLAHPQIAHDLIDAGVPTFVDKPLALDVDSAREVVGHARTAGVSLAVLFNRRYAPAYAETAGWPGLDTAILTKNRVGLPDDPRSVIFDDFVHVIDTLRFLVTPTPDQVQAVARRGPGGGLARLAVTMRQADRFGVGVMDRDGGMTLEVLEVMAPGRSRQVTDLVAVVDRADGRACSSPLNNWGSVSTQRGFTAMVAAALDSVRAGEVLDARDALATHELCEQVLAEVTTQLA